MLKKHGVDTDYLYRIPIVFQKDLEVSARTLHGVVYLNAKLVDKPEECDHYCVHELTHHFQQCHGDEATVGSTNDQYLESPFEIEGFQNQVEYLKEEEGKPQASAYVEKVLDHHDYHGKERQEKKEELMANAGQQLSLFDPPKEETLKSTPSPKITAEEMRKYLEDWDAGRLPVREPKGRLHEKLDPKVVKWRLKRLEELLRAIE